ncbi:hypothetical protein [Fusobacterium polymorphum]|jgi:hypothetical protein|uniref:hypothetical protein n=1 Tax=Fusobacterium nucleatum subsp. polymorphum TaxID=76857 RepID=UPI001C6EBCC1|nr:hypothetical protein [Fusobacterium polymorphum]QYR60244.1 hypothetical protein JY397_12135 [Fusobacterium polymorphum]
MSTEIKNTEKDFKMMIEKSYDILTNYEKKNTEFYNTFKEVDKKIIEKETAFANAKSDLREFIEQFSEEYKTYLTKVSNVFKDQLNQANEEFKSKMISTAEKVEAQKQEITELKKELTSTKKLIFYILGINTFLAGAIIYLILK